MESPKLDVDPHLLTTRQRLDNALRFMAEDNPARNPAEAREMFVRAFQKAEADLPEAERRLNLASVPDMTEIVYDTKKVLISVYKRHMLLLGEHGAVEVRLTPSDEFDESSPPPYTNLKLVFEKRGVDKRLLWE